MLQKLEKAILTALLRVTKPPVDYLERRHSALCNKLALADAWPRGTRVKLIAAQTDGCRCSYCKSPEAVWTIERFDADTGDYKINAGEHYTFAYPRQLERIA